MVSESEKDNMVANYQGILLNESWFEFQIPHFSSGKKIIL
jgi:hypothetical protein